MELTFDPDTHTYCIDGKKVPSVTQICDLLTMQKYGAGAALIRQAARRGSAVHEYCELIDYDAPPDEIEPELVGYVRAYLTFLRDYRPDWTHVEYPVYHSCLLYAGKCDRRGIIDGKITIVDLKTTSSMDRPAKISLACQLAGYNLAALNMGMPVAEQLMGVQLKRDGTYTVHMQDNIESRYKFDSEILFLDLLSITRLIGGYRA